MRDSQYFLRAIECALVGVAHHTTLAGASESNKELGGDPFVRPPPRKRQKRWTLRRGLLWVSRDAREVAFSTIFKDGSFCMSQQHHLYEVNKQGHEGRYG